MHRNNREYTNHFYTLSLRDQDNRMFDKKKIMRNLTGIYNMYGMEGGWQVWDTRSMERELQCTGLQNLLVESSKCDSMGHIQHLIHLCISDLVTSCNRLFMCSGSELF